MLGVAIETLKHILHTLINRLSTRNGSLAGKWGIFQYIVDNQMLSNYYTLATVAANLDARLRGRTIREAYTQEKNELVLSFEGLSECLVISCLPNTNVLYLHPGFSRARINSVDVLKTTAGKSVLSVSIQRGDRVISFGLQDDLTMYAQLFGSKANVLVVDNEQRIVDAFKDARALAGKSYSPSRVEFIHDATLLRTPVHQEPSQTVLALLKKASPVLGTTLATEILFRSGLLTSSRAHEIDDEQLHRLESSFTTALSELSRPASRVYVHKEPPHAPHRFSIVKLTHCHEFEEKTFPDIHDAIRFFISRSRASGVLKSRAQDIIASLRQQRTKLQRTITAVEEDLEKTARAEEYERYATLLMVNLGSVGKGMKSVTLSDARGEATILIDPRLSSVKNAQRYFEKAKKSKLASGQSRERLIELRGTLQLAESLLHEVEAIHTKEELKKYVSERASELERFGIGEKAKEREQLPFRIFTVDGGFEVWAGKSSRNNDELTMKYAKPNDLWFHARGASGSHVILKTNSGKGEPGKKAKEQAAAIAAYYSKMKNAGMVPVAMTEKKYVRKPKGSPPGTVVLEREKVIFAEPALPESSNRA